MVEEDKFKADIERLQMTVEEQECILIGIQSQLEQKKEQLSFVMDEKVFYLNLLMRFQLPSDTKKTVCFSCTKYGWKQY